MSSLPAFSSELLFKAPEQCLVAWAEAANDAYSNSSSGPLLTDDQWDDLVDAIEQRFPHRREWLQSIKVVDDHSENTDIGPHFPMTSLSKVHTEKELSAFMSTAGVPKDCEFLVQDKVDGLSIQLVQSKADGLKMFTRRHPVGQDISFLVPFFVDHGSLLHEECDILSVRGELVLPKDCLNKVREQYDPDAVNCRNTLAGAINSLISCHRSKSLPSEKDLAIVAMSQLFLYEVLHPSDWTYQKQHEQLGFVIRNRTVSTASDIEISILKICDKFPVNSYSKLMAAWKLPVSRLHVVESMQVARSEISVDYLAYLLQERKNAQPYDMDGLTIKIAQRCRDLSQMLSGKWKDPKNATAFKVKAVGTPTIVTGVTWSISKLGRIKPTLCIEPVKIGQVTADKATAHNAKYVYSNSIGRGAVVELIHSGDVIPYVCRVVKAAKTPDMPSDIKWRWSKSEVDIEVDEDNEITRQSRLVKQLEFLAKTFEMKNVGEGLLEAIVKGIPLREIEDFFDLDETALAKSVSIKGIGPAKRKIVMDGLNKVSPFLNPSKWDELDFGQKQQMFAKIMSTSGKFGAGSGLNICMSILTQTTSAPPWSNTQLQSIDLIGPERAEQYASCWPEFESWMVECLHVNWPRIRESLWPRTGKPISVAPKHTVKVVLSGFRDKEFANKLSNDMVSVESASSVTRTTALLVVADDTDFDKPTGKVKDAKHLKVGIAKKSDAKNWIDCVYVANATCEHGCNCNKDCANCGTCNERHLNNMRIVGWK